MNRCVRQRGISTRLQRSNRCGAAPAADERASGFHPHCCRRHGPPTFRHQRDRTLEHGLWRATTPELTQQRRLYLDEVFATIPVQPFTKEMAQLAAKIDAEARKQGVTIPFADLQIGVTALHFGYAIGTSNVRHFRMIPDLELKQL